MGLGIRAPLICFDITATDRTTKDGDWASSSTPVNTLPEAISYSSLFFCPRIFPYLSLQ